MKLIKTKLKDLFILQTDIFKDNRGFFKEVEKKKILNKKFVFDCFSFSKKNTLRGLHLQRKKSQAKLLTVVQGKILDVVVDLRKKSKTYGKKYSIILSDKNVTSLYIPAGFAHGFCSLEKENIVLYACTNYRSKKDEVGILWSDTTLKIKWPIKKPIISNKDKKNMLLNSFIKKFK